MIGMQYNLPVGFVSVSASESKWKNEPISVLDTRSPSPSTSTSTLSSSLGGGGGTAAGSGGSGSTENTASLAPTVSLPPESGFPAGVESAGGLGGGGRKDEWASDLQPIPAGGERVGLGLEDWDSLLSESGQDPSIFRWIAGEVDDGSFSLKQLLQGTNPNEVYGSVDQSSGASAGGGSTTTGNHITSLTYAFPCAGSGSSPHIPNSSGGGFDKNSANPQIPNFSSSLNNSILSSGVNYQQLQQQPQLGTLDEKPQIFNPQLSQGQNLFPPPYYAQQGQLLRPFQPHPKRQNLGVLDPDSQIPKVPFSDPGHEFFLRKQQQMGLAQQVQILPPHHLQQKPMTSPKQEVIYDQQQQQQQQVVYDQLYKAAELILAGNFSHAQGILARLNHQLSSPVLKSFQRVAFYFKEALQLPLLLMPSNPATTTTTLPLKSPTPFDGMFKMGAYKLLSEISPLVQFMNFTSNQAILEALNDDADCVHVIDFDIGFGAQWASFMQELPGRNSRGGSTPSFKITAFASPSTHHPLELGLMHENLTQFANEIGVNFELEVVNFDVFDPNSYSVPIFRSSEMEAIVVNLPIWACSSRPAVLPSLLRFVKQLSPKIMVSLERGCERADLPFPLHLLNAVQYYEGLLDSIDAANANSEVMDKIEKFLLQPRIESVVLGRIHSPEPMPHWKALFASAGFSPVAFSNFAETQAECVLKRSQVRGFHVEKRQASLVLYWQRRELMLASTWRC